MRPKIVHLIAAARPNFMKVAPRYHELARQSWCTARIVHTGQHYGANMSDAFFRDLQPPGMPTPISLPKGSRRRRWTASVHPRTRGRLEEFALLGTLTGAASIRLTAPLGYLELMSLVMGCTIAITDSGGVQEETTYLGIPCATLRENPNARSRFLRGPTGC